MSGAHPLKKKRENVSVRLDQEGRVGQKCSLVRWKDLHTSHFQGR
jgi:hypothetical protein